MKILAGLAALRVIRSRESILSLSQSQQFAAFFDPHFTESKIYLFGGGSRGTHTPCGAQSYSYLFTQEGISPNSAWNHIGYQESISGRQNAGQVPYPNLGQQQHAGQAPYLLYYLSGPYNFPYYKDISQSGLRNHISHLLIALSFTLVLFPNKVTISITAVRTSMSVEKTYLNPQQQQT